MVTDNANEDRAVIQVASPSTPVPKPKLSNAKIDRFLVEYDARKFRAYQCCKAAEHVIYESPKPGPSKI